MLFSVSLATRYSLGSDDDELTKKSKCLGPRSVPQAGVAIGLSLIAQNAVPSDGQNHSSRYFMCNVNL